MNISRKDWFFVGVVIAVIAVFVAISGKEKTKKVPFNDIHRPFYNEIIAGKGAREVDAQCATCHDGIKLPFPDKHPVKPSGGPMSCHLCHKYDKSHLKK